MGLSDQSPLDKPVTDLSGVGAKISEKLSAFGIETINDLLFHLPLRYQDKTQVCPIKDLQLGQEALIDGYIERAEIKFGRKRTLHCLINDNSGVLGLRFFHFSKAQQKRLRKGVAIRCYGQIRKRQHTLEMLHPEYTHINPDKPPTLDEQLTAIYPLTAGVKQRTMQNLCRQALAILLEQKYVTIELMPREVLASLEQPDIILALTYIHRPPPNADLQLLAQNKHSAQQRLAFEELLSNRLSLQLVRTKIKALPAPPLIVSGQLRNQFIAQLNFSLTQAQERVLQEIVHDITQATPMLRLLQGDVGSGKTVVAACAALHALEAGYQVVLMVPTELLAEQHFQNFVQWFGNLRHGEISIEVVLITGRANRAERDLNTAILRNSKHVVAIGTHALFQEHIIFSDLALVIIDEQHRFGVHQRLSLIDKGTNDGRMPHQLIMTATPIPRTLTMVAYASLDVSVIDALPSGRQAVNTVVIPNERRDDVICRVRSACDACRQVYWVCTLINESELLQCQAATATFKKLTQELNSINVGLIHGRMHNKEKEAVMLAFKKNDIQVLVATTVIEVGVDVPRASIMIIENAERLGLFQLHQLRGRVGRGDIKSDCLLMYQSPLSDLAKSRLDIMRSTNDGFVIAEKDLYLRGAGDLVGTRQVGESVFRIADIFRDAYLLVDVQRAAKILQQKWPDRIDKVINRWLGGKAKYSNI